MMIENALEIQKREGLLWDREIEKRCFDLVIASLMLILVAPVLLLVAIAIRLESRGPILFQQPRVGFSNELFTIFKFRTMFSDRTDINASQQTQRNDPRVTRVGKVLRKLSLDELPQLLNVLRGDMSLVGPRPHALETKAEGKLLQDVVDSYERRHDVRPGLTGWAQINGSRGEIRSIGEARERVKLDFEYIERSTLWLDIKIIVLTAVREVISRRAY